MQSEESANWQVEIGHKIYASEIWKNDWLPLKSMVDSGELEPADAMRQFRLILDERFKVRAGVWVG